MDDLEKLKASASPIKADLIEEVKITNKIMLGNSNLLAVNNKRLQTIIDYKELQKNGDIKFRKHSSLVGTITSTVSISISLTALYISIRGVPQGLINFLTMLG